MEHAIRQQIHDAADAAWQHFWETTPTSHQYDSWKGPTTEVDHRAVEIYRQSVRDKCVEAGVDERDYWLAAPGEAVVMRPTCLADQLDRIEADLAAARKQFERDSLPF